MPERGRHERWTSPVSQRELSRVFEAYAILAVRQGRVEAHRGVDAPGDVPASLFALPVDAVAVQRVIYPSDGLISLDPNGCELSYASSYIFEPTEPESPVSQVTLVAAGHLPGNRLRFVHTYSIVRDDFGERRLGGFVDSEYWEGERRITAEVHELELANNVNRIVAVASKNRPIEFPEVLKMSELVARL